MTDDDFQTVAQKSDWGYWDELDGKPLQAGELVEVQYPGGSIERGAVIIDDRPFTLSDGYTCQNSRAFIEFEFHDATVRLGLRWMEVRRVA